jgi:hypothetical protein
MYRQLFGEPIFCSINGVHIEVMDVHCWVYGTYTQTRGYVGMDGVDGRAAPGVTSLKDGEEIQHHQSFRLVPLILFLSAISFNFAHYIWKSVDNGKIEFLTKGLNNPILETGVKINRIKYLVQYFNQGRNHR